MRILVGIIMSLITILGFAVTLQEEAHAKTQGQSKRQKVIDFDDETIEGLNKRPLDSLSQISDAEKRRRKPHLYRKRTGFRGETSETLKVLRYTQ